MSARGDVRIAAFAARTAVLLILSGALTGPLYSQALNSVWRTVDAGGGVSVVGVYSVSGTIGQPDAGVPLVAGVYHLEGGFWRAWVALRNRLVFADGFAAGNTTAWSSVTALAPERGEGARGADLGAARAAPPPG